MTLARPDVKRTLLGHLAFIRERRNEAEHPGRIFTGDEAEETFLQTVDTLIEIYEEMKSSRSTG